MKRLSLILAIVMALVTILSVVPATAANSFGATLDKYDDYGYYLYYDFENYGSASKHSAYMEDANATNKDGKLSNPFGFNRADGNVYGTGVLKTEENGNKYYSFTQTHAAAGDYNVMGVFSMQSSYSAKNCLITDTAVLSFRFRMQETQPSDAAGQMMDLIHIRRGSNGANNNLAHVRTDTDGNIYACVNGSFKEVYHNPDKSKFIDISFVIYDASNTYSLYVNGALVVEAMALRNNYRDSSNVDVTFNDDFVTDSLTVKATASGHIRAIELCRAGSKHFAFDIDDIKLSRMETAQRGKVYFENSFDALYEGVTVRNGENSNVYRFSNGTSSKVYRSEADADGNRYLNISSGSCVAIRDNEYQLYTKDSFVIQVKVKGKPTHQNTVSGDKVTVNYKTLISLDDKINWFGAFYVDPDGNLYLEGNKPHTIVGGYKLEEDQWLDLALVFTRNHDNAGQFGSFKSGRNESTKNTVVSISYYINGEYVGSTSELTFKEWKISSTDSATGVSTGYTANNRPITITHTEIDENNEALDLSGLTVVADGVNKKDSKGNGIETDTNHIIYKTADGLTFYDVEYSTDGKSQLRYSTMVISATADTGANDLIKFFAGSNVNGAIDDIRIYEGTSPEWYYENVNSVEGGDILNVDFGKLALSGSNSKAQVSTLTGTDILGTFRSGEFINGRVVRKNAQGEAVTAENIKTAAYGTMNLKSGDWFDFFIPIPQTKNGIKEVEYSFEATIKNLNITSGANPYSGQLHMFRQRIEYLNPAGTEVKSTASGDLFCIDTNLKLWGGDYNATNADHRFPLCDENGNQIVIDNENWNTIRADLYCLKDGSNSFYAVSYYFNGERVYLEDGSVAYRIVDPYLTNVTDDYFGNANHRVRITQALGNDSLSVDVKSININANNLERPTYSAADVDTLTEGKVSVVEIEAPAYVNDKYDGYVSLVAIDGESTANSASVNGILAMESKTGKLVAKTENSYYELCDAEGQCFVARDEPLKVAVVIDKINGKIRYYVENAPAYIRKTDGIVAAANLIAPKADRYGTTKQLDANVWCFAGYADDTTFINSADYSVNCYNVNDADTAEIIGYQENSLDNGIRIIAGVDTLYYSNVGFEAEIFEGGVSMGKADVKDNVVFSSIVASGKTITAESRGYKYLATLNVSDLPDAIPDDSYIILRSFTEVSGVRRYDREVKLCVSDDGYSFGEIDDKDIYKKKQAILLIGQSNMAGRGDLATVEPITDPKITMMRKSGDSYVWVPMAEPIHTDKTIAGAGIGASFAKAFVECFDQEIGLIPAAMGGTSLTQWTKGYEQPEGSDVKDFDLYEKALAMAKEAQKDSEIVAILWHQGCSDMKTSAYAVKCQKIFDDFIADLGLDPEKIIIISGELAPQKGTAADHVNNSLASLVDKYENYAVATTENLLTIDADTHFDAPSLRVLGYRYFAHFYKFVTGKTYSFVDDIEHYRIVPEVDDSVDTNAYEANVNFNSLTAGTTYSSKTVVGNLDIRPGSAPIKVLANPNDANDKYLAIDWANSGTPPFVDVATPYAQGSTIVTEVKFMMKDGYNVVAPMLKLVQTSPKVASIHLIRVGLDGTLYNTNGNSIGAALVNPTTGSTYALDKFEWTTIKIVVDLANNTKDIYIDGTLCLEDAALTTSASDSAAFNTVITRIMQYDPNSGTSGTIYVDDFKSYHLPIANVNFEGSSAQTITSVQTIDGVTFSASSSKAPMAIIKDEDNTYASTSCIVTGNSNGYIDIPTASTAGRDLTVEAKFKIGDYNGTTFAAKGNIFKLLDPNARTIALVGLAADGSLHDYTYTTSSDYPQNGEKLGVSLSKTEWTTIKVVCHFATNTKDIYVNGELIKEGAALYRSDRTDSYVPATMRIMHYVSSGIGTIFLDDYISYN